MNAALRRAELADLARIHHVEREAGRRFLDVGIDVTPFGLLEVASMEKAIDDGLLPVLDVPDEGIVAFALCGTDDPSGQALHLHELDVLPDRQGQGLGKRLLDHVFELARDRGFREVTLTTFRDVPFNRPFYERRGFSVLSAPPPWLQAIRNAELASGVEVEPRVAMRRAV